MALIGDRAVTVAFRAGPFDEPRSPRGSHPGRARSETGRRAPPWRCPPRCTRNSQASSPSRHSESPASSSTSSALRATSRRSLLPSPANSGIPLQPGLVHRLLLVSLAGDGLTFSGSRLRVHPRCSGGRSAACSTNADLPPPPPARPARVRSGVCRMDGLPEPPPPPSGVVHLPYGRPRDLVAGGGRRSELQRSGCCPVSWPSAPRPSRSERSRSHELRARQRVALERRPGRGPALRLRGRPHRRLPAARRRGARARPRLRARRRRLLHDRAPSGSRPARTRSPSRTWTWATTPPTSSPRTLLGRVRVRAERPDGRPVFVGIGRDARRGRLPPRRRARRARRRRPARVRHPTAAARPGARRPRRASGSPRPRAPAARRWTGTWRAGSGRS